VTDHPALNVHLISEPAGLVILFVWAAISATV